MYKRQDIEGVKIGAGTHKRLADIPFRITSKTTGENHVVVTDDNGQFSTSACLLYTSCISVFISRKGGKLFRAVLISKDTVCCTCLLYTSRCV